MGEKVLRLKALTDPSDAVAGLAVIGNSLEKVGSAALATAERSKTEWRALEEQWRQANPTLQGIADAAFKAESALNKAAKVEDVSRLASELVKAQQAVDLFAAKLKQIEDGGGVVDEKTLSTLSAYESAVTSLKGKMELLGAAQAEAAAKIKGGEEGLTGLAAAAKEAESATAALSAVRGPEQLEGAIKRGAWASIQLREEMDRAAAAGEKVDDKTVTALKAVEAQTQANIEKMTRFRKEMGDAGESAKLATDKLDALKGASGGLGNAFDSMEKSGTGLTKAIGSFGIALGAAGAAIAGAVAAGKELGESIDKLSAKYAGWQQKKIDAALMLQKQEIALRAADRGMIEHGKTIEQTVENYDKYALAQGKLSEGARKVAEEIGGLKIPPTYEDLGRQVEAIGLAFEGAYKRGEEFGDRMLLENASVIEGLIEKYGQLGKEVPEDLAELAKSLEQLKGSGDAAAAGIGAVAEKTMTLAEAAAEAGPSLDGMRERIMDTAEASKVAAAVNSQYTAQLAASAPVLDEYGRTVDQSEAHARNTAALAESTGALAAQDAELRAGLDAWETAGAAMGPFSVAVRQATDGYVETGDAVVDLIERLARANDQLGELAVFAGSWIAELEAGNITTGEFRTKLDELSVGLPYYSALLRAAGVDAAETAQAISGMYAALNDATFLRPAAEWWEQFGISMESAFFKARDAAKTLREELEDVEVVAGRVNAAVSGPRGTIDPEDLEDGMRKPSKPKREPGYR